MKKSLMIILAVLFIFSGNAYAEDKWDSSGNRWGLSLNSGSKGGVIYYGKDFGWAAGVLLGAEESNIDIANTDTETSELGFRLFARKNFKIHEKTFLGIGVTGGLGDVDLEIPSGDRAGNYDGTSYTIAPYLLVNYHLSNHIVLSGGARIIKYTYLDVEDRDDMSASSTDYFKPFVTVGYLF